MERKLEQLLNNVGDLNFKRRIKEILKYLDIQQGEKVLDMGCGDGFYSMILSELYKCDICAVDYDQKLLDNANENIRNLDRVQFSKVDITKGLPFPDNYFDKIVFTEVLEHLDNDLGALKELYRVLKKKGKMALTVPHSNYPFFWDPINWVLKRFGLGHTNPKNALLGGVWSYDHKRLYTVEELKNLVTRADFKILCMKGLTHHTLPFNLTLLYIGKQAYTSIPFSSNFKASLEKFEGHNQRKRSCLVDIPFKIVMYIDEKNENIDFINKNTFITIFSGLHKT